MSHEIRTPLAAILGFTGLLGTRPGLDEVSLGYLERVNFAGQALLALVNDILDFSKLEAGQVEVTPKSISPTQLAQGSLLIFTPQAEAKGLALHFLAEDGVPDLVRLDPDRMRQVLLNLIGNAVKFTDAGSVTLRLGYNSKAQQLHVAVEDTGPGLTRAQQKKLFQRFSQVDGSSTRRHGGTGLGLAICKAVVEAMGGSIGVRAAPGVGSTFHFYMAAPEVTATAVHDLEAAPAPRIEDVRVLVVDDNPANRLLASTILEGVGAEVTLAASGEEGVETALALPFDVILMDMRMPGMDGETAVQRLRSQPGPNQAIPILAFTADADLSRFTDPAGGFTGAVSKPLQPDALLTAIAQCTGWDDADTGSDGDRANAA
jgi:CheY-like chemotaxis protein/anti-sigma regulatory factor (Ser/Thr protein kinase)